MPPQAKPQPVPPDTYDRVSGKDQETTRPRPAEEKGPAAAPKLAEPEPRRDEAAEFPALKFQPKAPTSRPAPKEAPRQTAPELAQRVTLNARLGDKDQSGDPYLNAFVAKLEQHRSYPAAAIGSLGLHLSGIVVYLIEVSAAGELLGTQLERSSGSPLLDETALKMIQQAAPFPILPSNYPRSSRNDVVVEWTAQIFPEGQ
jgi:protein TonB